MSACEVTIILTIIQGVLFLIGVFEKGLRVGKDWFFDDFTCWICWECLEIWFYLTGFIFGFQTVGKRANLIITKEESSYVLQYCAEKNMTNYWKSVANAKKPKCYFVFICFVRKFCSYIIKFGVFFAFTTLALSIICHNFFLQNTVGHRFLFKSGFFQVVFV